MTVPYLKQSSETDEYCSWIGAVGRLYAQSLGRQLQDRCEVQDYLVGLAWIWDI
jgi:hypothetical protein